MTLEEITSGFESKGSDFAGMDPNSARVILEFMEDFNIAKIFSTANNNEEISTADYGVKFL